VSASTLETRECDEFPRAGTSFERALQVRTTPVASVGDILKAVGEEDRSDFHQSHLAFAIRTDIHSRLYGTAFPSPDKMSGRAKSLTLGLGACQSEKQELELARSLCDSGSITNIIVRPLFTRVEKKEASYGAGRDADDVWGLKKPVC